MGADMSPRTWTWHGIAEIPVLGPGHDVGPREKAGRGLEGG